MAKGLITHAYLEDTADAIRVLRGESNTYTPDEFGEKIIDAIPDVEVTNSIVSVTDAAAYPAEGLEFAIEPVQDLHGYDKPWPAGGGKNKANVSDYSKSFTDAYYVDAAMGVTLEAGVTYTFSCDVNSTVTPFLISVGTGSGGIYRVDILTKSSQDNGRVYVTFTPTAKQLTDYTELYFRAPRFTTPQTGTVSVSNIQLELGSTATSYEPYSNICPISGWTGVNGERTGKNLLDISSVIITTVTGNVTFTVNRNDSGNVTSIVANGTASRRIYFELGRYTLNSGTILSGCPSGGGVQTFGISVDGTSIADYGSGANVSENYTNALITIIVANGQVCNNLTFKPMIRLASDTDPTFEPYTGTSIPITFPTEAGTVYGGKVDVKNGKLTVERAEVDLGDLNWTQEGNHFYSEFINNALAPISNYVEFSGLSDNYKTTTQYAVAQESNNCTIAMSNSKRLYVYDDRYSDTATFTTAVTGSKLVYELATPIEYDLTSQQVQMLLGDNNVWCDTGNTTLEYKVDLGRFIAKLQAGQTPQLSLSRQAVSLDAERDVEVRTDENIEDSESIGANDVR